MSAALQTQPLAVSQTGTMLNPEALISKALEHNVPVESLERLLALRAQIKAEQAQESYLAALAAFQAACPVITKNKQVRGKDGGVRYSYAPMESIIQQCGALLDQHGFSYSFSTESAPGGVLVSCHAHHRAGHSEISTVPVPIEKDAFMNDAQKTGSAMTYAKRYAFCNAFGILTGDQDDDAKAAGPGQTPSDLYRYFSRTMEAVLNHHESILMIKEACETGFYDVGAAAWSELDDDTKRALWVAPSKGGPFTTSEREIMKSAAWFNAATKNQSEVKP